MSFEVEVRENPALERWREGMAREVWLPSVRDWAKFVKARTLAGIPRRSGRLAKSVATRSAVLRGPRAVAAVGIGWSRGHKGASRLTKAYAKRTERRRRMLERAAGPSAEKLLFRSVRKHWDRWAARSGMVAGGKALARASFSTRGSIYRAAKSKIIKR